MMIPYGKQAIDQDDIDAVVNVLKSDYLTQGPTVPAFEQAMANRCMAKHAIATTNATSALHIANLALGVEASDIVWTTPISFVASANCVLYCNASIDFVDIDITTGNICINALKQKLEQANNTNNLPKALIVVHLSGHPCNMEAIAKLVRPYGIRIIEDASHAVGSTYQNKPIGNCEYSDLTIFSFHPVKIITTAEGGMVLTNNDDLAEKLRLLRSHGITNVPEQMTEPSHGPWYYQQIELGFNYRMTELQAALGLSQLKKLDDFVNKRNQLAQNYLSAFSQTKIQCLSPLPDSQSAYHLFVILLPTNDEAVHKNAISHLRSNNIFAHVHYIPIHLQPYYQKLGFTSGDYPQAESYYQRAISLPLFPDLKHADQQYIIDHVKALI